MHFSHSDVISLIYFWTWLLGFLVIIDWYWNSWSAFCFMDCLEFIPVPKELMNLDILVLYFIACCWGFQVINQIKHFQIFSASHKSNFEFWETCENENKNMVNAFPEWRCLFRGKEEVALLDGSCLAFLAFDQMHCHSKLELGSWR